MYFISVNNGRSVVTKVHRTRRTQKMTGVETSNDPQWAIRTDKETAELIARECDGKAEPISQIMRFYR